MSGLSRDRRERLLRVRKVDEGVERGRWARAKLELESRRVQAEACGAKREAVADEIRRESRGALNLARLRGAAECREAIARDRERAEAVVRGSEREAETRRRALDAANRRVRAIEKLDEKRTAEEAARLRAAESREQDDRFQPRERP